MKTITPEPKVGLLLFDEPSASLDPTAEHGDFFLPSYYPSNSYCML
jgi:hypothetical protein